VYDRYEKVTELATLADAPSVEEIVVLILLGFAILFGATVRRQPDEPQPMPR
jgi:hypothetical protein